MNDVFVQNFCNLSAWSISIESGPEDKGVSMRFPGESELNVRWSEFEGKGERMQREFEKVLEPIRDGFANLNANE
jgi:hypothetical protein